MRKIRTLSLSIFLGLLLIAPYTSLADKPLEGKKSKKEHTIFQKPTQSTYSPQLLNTTMTPPALSPMFLLNMQINLFQLMRKIDGPALKFKTPKKNVGRALLEATGHFAYSATSYWIRKEVMMEDWEYKLNFKDQLRRFTFADGFRFDSNSFQFNWTHSLAGTIYYNYARANHLNALESFLFCAGSSYFWEFVIEYREVISINDMIGTVIGGLSIGESMFQLGRFFRSKRPTFVNRIARILSNPILSINEWLDRKRYNNPYSFAGKDYWNECRLFFGPRFDNSPHSGNREFFQLGIETQLNLIPEYAQPGISSRYIKRTAFTQFDINGTVHRKGLYEFNIFAKTALFGYLNQNIQPIHSSLKKNKRKDKSIFKDDILENYKGYSMFLGVATAFDLTKKNSIFNNEDSIPLEDPNFRDPNDKFCIINILGPTLDYSLFYKKLKIRFVGDAYADFSLIHSHAFQKYSSFIDIQQTKSTLENHDYYYALGYTLSTLLHINYSNLELKGKFKYHYFDSIEGMDRFQNNLKPADDFDLKDHRWFYNMSLGYQIPKTPIQVVLGWERWERKGSIENFVQSSSEQRSYIQIKYLF